MANEKVRNLSGGQARRVEIARSMLHRPGLLLLDEPTVGLDIGSRESVISIVRGLVKSEGLGVLWATHLIDEISDTDHIIVLHKGRVLFTGTLPGFLASNRSRQCERCLPRHDWNHTRGGRMNVDVVRAPATSARTRISKEPSRLGPLGYLACFRGIVWREVLRFLHQRERFFSALVRPLVWLFIFAAGFRQVLGVSIIPPYETYILYEVYVVPGLVGMILLVQCHAVVAVDGLRPRDRSHAHAARQPFSALVPVAV